MMPTGYTAKVQSGEIATLRDFALCCARAFGALVEMRDDPSYVPTPHRLFARTAHHDKCLAEAKEAIAGLPGLSAVECDRRAQDAFDIETATYTKDTTERIAFKARYQKMEAKVQSWVVPPELANLRKFMLDQIIESIRFDCSGNYNPDVPARLTGEQWRERELATATADFSYHSKAIAEEIERTNSSNRWLKALWDSLPP